MLNSGREKLLVLGLTFALCALHFALAQEQPSSGELIVKAWGVHGKKDAQATFQYTQQLIDLYAQEADIQQASLKGLPKNRPDIEQVAALNDVATAYFIQGESYRYHRTAAQPVTLPKVSQLPTKIVLYEPGKEGFVDYRKYGEFKNIGTRNYIYIVKDQEALARAVGEGIYPNTTSVRWDPEFKKAQKEKRLEGSHWDFVHSADLEAAFLKWATCPEPQGVKLFYTGLIFEKSGLIKEAIKSYYAAVVHFPGSYGWTYWHTPWYVGQAAIAKIKFLLRNNPQLGYKLGDADIKIINGYDNDVSNDIVIASPGKFVKINILEKFPAVAGSRPKREKAKNPAAGWRTISITTLSRMGRMTLLWIKTGITFRIRMSRQWGILV
ncbi:MAG: hypothetical protein NT066_00995 [Candidatus Omnitrophica bacterium]|nr:hypothetical protein [Candidatus Omnitrophota bacterium]